MYRPSDLVENRVAKFLVGRRRLLGIELNHFPAFWQAGHQPTIDLHEIKRVDVVDAIGRTVESVRLGLENCREVRSVLGSGDHRERIATEHRKERQSWSQLGDPSHLARSLCSIQVNDVIWVNIGFGKCLHGPAVAWVPLQNVIECWIAEVVELDPVNLVRQAICIEGRRKLITLDDAEVELDRILRFSVGSFEQYRFAVDYLGDPCSTQLARELYVLAPLSPLLLDRS